MYDKIHYKLKKKKKKKKENHELKLELCSWDAQMQRFSGRAHIMWDW